MMYFFNVTDVLTNRVNCSGSTFNLTILKSCARLARPIWAMTPGRLLTDAAYNIYGLRENLELFIRNSIMHKSTSYLVIFLTIAHQNKIYNLQTITK